MATKDGGTPTPRKLKPMWTYWDLEMQVDKLSGGIPKHPELVRRWQEAHWPANEAKLQPGDPLTPEEASLRTIEELGNQALEQEEQIAGIWTGFAERDGGLVLEERQVRAMLKESANIVRSMPQAYVDGKPIFLRAKLAERVFVKPTWIPLGVSEASASPERPISVMTPRGPRTALKRVDVIYDCKVAVVLEVLNDGMITEGILRAILDHASRNGLGTDRSTGSGTFRYTLTPREGPWEG